MEVFSGVRPVDVTATMRGRVDVRGMVERVLISEWEQRSGGEMRKPQVRLNVGVPPERYRV